MKLTPRETLVLSEYWNGLSTKEIAFKLHRSFKTIEFHRSNLLMKFGTDSLVKMLRCALRLGIISFGLVFTVAMQAGTVTFAWDRSTSTNVSGYTLYGSTNPLTNTNFHSSPLAVDCGTNTVCSLASTNLGQWYFAVTAYAWDQTNRIESDLSNILPLRFPPVPTNFVFLIPQYTATIAGTNWQDIGFFRVKIGMP